MKNYLCIENIKSSKNDTLLEIIKSSSEMEGYSITNILESDEKTLWLSIEQLPQEITINLNKDLFKELPKKISAIGIYCWHAYPTNPKLIEIQISKNKGISFISLGNFDLCLKPGKQLLQFDYEINPSLVKDNTYDIIIKLIIKETFGDKRTYINNIYLYENINMLQKQLMPNMEPIKEEDSNSMIYLRESREKVLTKNVKGIDTIKENTNNINNEESESLISDSDLSEKYNNNKDNKNIELNDKKKDNIKNNERYLNDNENEILMEMNKQINLMLEKENMKDIQQDNEISSKEKSLNINDFNNEEENDDIYDNKQIKKDINKSNSINDSINEQNLNLLIEEFNKYKNYQEKRMIDYENKIKNLEIEYNEMLLLNNKMKETLDTLLESQMIQQNDNHENILNTMRDIIYFKINNVFNNFNPMPNYNIPFNNQRNFYFNNNENYFDNNNRRAYNNREMNNIPINTRKNIYEHNITERDYHTNKYHSNNVDNNIQKDHSNYPLREHQYSTIYNKNRINPINVNNDKKYVNFPQNKSKKENKKYKDNK